MTKIDCLSYPLEDPGMRCLNLGSGYFKLVAGCVLRAKSAVGRWRRVAISVSRAVTIE